MCAIFSPEVLQAVTVKGLSKFKQTKPNHAKPAEELLVTQTTTVRQNSFRTEVLQPRSFTGCDSEGVKQV